MEDPAIGTLSRPPSGISYGPNGRLAHGLAAKSWENHGKIMGKSWENHGKIMGKSSITWGFHGNWEKNGTISWYKKLDMVKCNPAVAGRS